MNQRIRAINRWRKTHAAAPTKLPLAIHLRRGLNKPACGGWVPEERLTNDKAKITCKLCVKRTAKRI